MSEHADEQLYRIACSLEKIADNQRTVDEDAIAAGVFNAMAIEVESILDKTINEFELRRQLRKLIEGIKKSSQ